MATEGSCIYCQRSDIEFCRAHVLPRGLGNFQDQPTLVEKVCAKCDSIIGQYEDQFIHCGIAAFMRPRLGLRGRSAFRRGHVGQDSIELKTTDPISGYEILVEPTEEVQPAHEMHQCKALPQLVLEDSEGKTSIVKLFHDDGLKEISASTLKEDVKKTGLNGRLRITAFGLTQEQEEYIFSLLKVEETEVSGKKGEPQVIPVKSQAQVTCDKRYFQAVAKIAFHYYLISEDCLHDGYEDKFEPIRRFILNGEGEIEDFVQTRRGYLTRDTANGWRPKYYGHIFVGNVNRRAIDIKLKFFIGPDCDLPYYDVTVCKNPFAILLRHFSFGHNYVYYEPGESKHGYKGIMQKLGAANRIILPKVF